MEIVTTSPWIKQLKRIRPIDRLDQDWKTDIVIIGGGISGVITAYFLLKYTDLKVTVIEGSLIAHGATGHNAGQLTSYFERPFISIVKEYGLEMASRDQSYIHLAWDLLKEVMTSCRLTTPIHTFNGYAGLTTKDQILDFLTDLFLQREGGLDIERMYISEEWLYKKDIPENFSEVYEFIPKSDLLSKLETKDKNFQAALVSRKGVMNSAMFVEELVGFLLSNYTDRFFLFEQTYIDRVILRSYDVVLQSGINEITAKKCILCTNGFEKIKIINKAGNALDQKFHRNVKGVVGFMAGYLEDKDKEPTAISYFDEHFNADDPDNNEYIYMTRRPYELKEHNTLKNLVALGGPEFELEEDGEYQKDKIEFSHEAMESIDNFLKQRLEKNVEEYAFKWHGLMGYTSSMLRLIGPEPFNDNLLYNLGCNGVGILPSIYGGRKIAQFINGEKLEPSIFDPVR